MKLKFTKMHGLGNDFVLVDCREGDPGNWPELSLKIADRHFGVGCDQILLLRDSDRADFKMDIWNSDGTRVEMCGNGIRCFAAYLKDKGLIKEFEARIETMAGLQVCRLMDNLVEVDMGEPELEGRRIPVDADGFVREFPISVDGVEVLVTCVSMGNPHAVVFVDDAGSFPVSELGPKIEKHPFFPKKANVEFAEVKSRNEVRMRVWERGSGMTMACGTGACASAVAAFWTGRTDREVKVALDGGDLNIVWEAESNHVFMTGPAVTVFEGEFFL